MTTNSNKNTAGQDISFGSRTDIGYVRDHNEDSLIIIPPLFAVADGMGGHQGGDYASRYTVEHMISKLASMETKSPIAAINDAILQINAELYEQGRMVEELQGMGTTLVAATISGSTLYVANVGDSRLYRISDHLKQVTRDHSWVEEMIREGRMTRDSAIYWEKKNIITRAIGAYERVTADFFEVELNPGDRILLCSDGLSNMVEDRQIEQILLKTENRRNLTAAGRELIAAGKANGGKDNLSVVLVDPELDEVKKC